MDDDQSAAAGDPRVAEVLAELEGLDELAVDQHVAVFEMAHARLRGLLTDQGQVPHPAPGSAGA